MGNAVLSCNATSIVPITFHWEFSTDNDTWGTLPSNTTLVVSIHTTNIITMNTTIISSINIQQSDEGNYRCIANNSAGTSVSDVATVTAYGEL